MGIDKGIVHINGFNINEFRNYSNNKSNDIVFVSEWNLAKKANDLFEEVPYQIYENLLHTLLQCRLSNKASSNGKILICVHPSEPITRYDHICKEYPKEIYKIIKSNYFMYRSPKYFVGFNSFLLLEALQNNLSVYTFQTEGNLLWKKDKRIICFDNLTKLKGFFQDYV